MLTYAIIGLIIGVIAAIIYIATGDYEPQKTGYNILEAVSRTLMGILIVVASVCLWAPILVGGGTVILLACIAG